MTKHDPSTRLKRGYQRSLIKDPNVEEEKKVTADEDASPSIKYPRKLGDDNRDDVQGNDEEGKEQQPLETDEVNLVTTSNDDEIPSNMDSIHIFDDTDKRQRELLFLFRPSFISIVD